MWGCNTRVVIIPIIMAFTFLVLWMAGITGNYIDQNGVESPDWCAVVVTTSIAISMSLNALVTSLIAIRIFRAVKGNTTFYENLKSLGGSQVDFRYIIFVIIESGMVLFSIQFARVVSTALRPEGTIDDLDAFNFIVSLHEMLNGIIPTIILVRVSMGLSFDDETSMKEAAESLRFVRNDPYSIPESLRSTVKENGSSCENDAIQMSERRSTSETTEKSIDLKDSYIYEEGDHVESV